MKKLRFITNGRGAATAAVGVLVGSAATLFSAFALSDAVATRLTSLAPPLTALVVAYVGLQQWLTAREKVRLDLYSRRFSTLQTAVRYVHAATGEFKELSENELSAVSREFIAAMIESRFLFDAEVHDLMKKLREVGFRYDQTKRTGPIQGLPPQDVILRGAGHNADFFAMDKLLGDLQIAMEPFMSFGATR